MAANALSQVPDAAQRLYHGSQSAPEQYHALAAEALNIQRIAKELDESVEYHRLSGSRQQQLDAVSEACLLALSDGETLLARSTNGTVARGKGRGNAAEIDELSARVAAAGARLAEFNEEYLRDLTAEIDAFHVTNATTGRNARTPVQSLQQTIINAESRRSRPQKVEILGPIKFPHFIYTNPMDTNDQASEAELQIALENARSADRVTDPDPKISKALIQLADHYAFSQRYQEAAFAYLEYRDYQRHEMAKGPSESIAPALYNLAVLLYQGWGAGTADEGEALLSTLEATGKKWLAVIAACHALAKINASRSAGKIALQQMRAAHYAYQSVLGVSSLAYWHASIELGWMYLAFPLTDRKHGEKHIRLAMLEYEKVHQKHQIPARLGERLKFNLSVSRIMQYAEQRTSQLASELPEHVETVIDGLLGNDRSALAEAPSANMKLFEFCTSVVLTGVFCANVLPRIVKIKKFSLEQVQLQSIELCRWSCAGLLKARGSDDGQTLHAQYCLANMLAATAASPFHGDEGIRQIHDEADTLLQGVLAAVATGDPISLQVAAVQTRLALLEENAAQADDHLGYAHALFSQDHSLQSRIATSLVSRLRASLLQTLGNPEEAETMRRACRTIEKQCSPWTADPDDPFAIEQEVNPLYILSNALPRPFFPHRNGAATTDSSPVGTRCLHLNTDLARPPVHLQLGPGCSPLLRTDDSVDLQELVHAWNSTSRSDTSKVNKKSSVPNVAFATKKNIVAFRTALEDILSTQCLVWTAVSPDQFRTCIVTLAEPNCTGTLATEVPVQPRVQALNGTNHPDTPLNSTNMAAAPANNEKPTVWLMPTVTVLDITICSSALSTSTTSATAATPSPIPSAPASTTDLTQVDDNAANTNTSKRSKVFGLKRLMSDTSTPSTHLGLRIAIADQTPAYRALFEQESLAQQQEQSPAARYPNRSEQEARSRAEKAAKIASKAADREMKARAKEERKGEKKERGISDGDGPELGQGQAVDGRIAADLEKFKGWLVGELEQKLR